MDNQPASTASSPQNNTAQSVTQPSSGNRKKYIFFLTIGIVVLIIVSSIAFAVVKFTQQSQTQQLQQKTNTGDPTRTPILNDQQITIPISIEDPQTTSVGFVYKYETQLKEISQEGSRVKLITDTKNPNPWFIISPDTELFFRSADGKFRPAKIEDLKPGQNLEILTAYGLQSKRWLTQRIFILESNNNTDDF